MTGEEATLAVSGALEALAIPYMLVGSFASNYYGIPRSTKDADFVVSIGARSVHDLVSALGTQFHLDPQTSFETITMTVRHVFQVAGTPFEIEVFHLSDDLHDQERFRRRRSVSLLGRQVVLPTVEDVIITKLRWAVGPRSKDWNDARDVIAVQGQNVDWAYVHAWCDQHGTRALLDEIRASIPPI